MNNKDFISALAGQCGLTSKETQRLSNILTTGVAEMLDDETTLSIQGFGMFEVKKKMERVVTNPATKKRILVPPRLAMSFHPGATLKDKIK